MCVCLDVCVCVFCVCCSATSVSGLKLLVYMNV